MGSNRGFMTYERLTPKDRPAIERLRDWEEFRDMLPEKDLRLQGARCMDCGVPFCHTGAVLGPMPAGCPLHNLVPEWNDMVYRGLWKEAADALLKTNPFPEFTARVCPALCEGSCTLGMNREPVAIKSIEHAIIERAYAEGWITPHPPKTRTGKKVAVVGSGPSGMACAWRLNRLGHTVTIFEREDRPGGLLMYGIPNMKLDKGVVMRRIELMEKEGIEFVTGVAIGKDKPVADLKKEFDAVVLCCGATKPRDLPIEGRELSGIYYAVDFLTGATKMLLAGLDPGDAAITARDKNVVMIGGGDTGTDCVATSIRMGCKNATQLEILSQPPKSRAENNPWPEYPKVLKTDYGQIEAATIYGNDPRSYLISAKRFIGDESGQVKQIQAVKIEWELTNGRFAPVEVPNSETIIDADLVILAMGFLGPEDTVPGQLDLKRDARSNVQADETDYATSIPGVFAAGDVRRGQSLVVWAMDEGINAADSCDRYLQKK